MRRISVICPVYNEEKFIKDCIESIYESDYPLDKMEILFIDGMSTDCTREIIMQYASRLTQIRLLNNPGRIVPSALNIGIKEATGEIIFRLDAHAIYPKNYFSVLADYLEKLGADNVGGICRTLAINDTDKCVAIACALSCSFGMGNSYFRIGTKDIRPVDTVPFGCFRRNVFEKVGLFDEELIRNQDDEFNGRIIKKRGSIYLIPEIVVDYFARDSIKKVVKMFYQYGLFKPLVNKKLGSPVTVRQFFPFLFVCGLIFGGVLAVFSVFFGIIYYFVLILYFFIGLFFAVQESLRKKNWRLVFLLPVIFFLIHISYGTGYIVGIYKILFQKPFLVQVNR